MFCDRASYDAHSQEDPTSSTSRHLTATADTPFPTYDTVKTDGSTGTTASWPPHAVKKTHGGQIDGLRLQPGQQIIMVPKGQFDTRVPISGMKDHDLSNYETLGYFEKINESYFVSDTLIQAFKSNKTPQEMSDETFDTLKKFWAGDQYSALESSNGHIMPLGGLMAALTELEDAVICGHAGDYCAGGTAVDVARYVHEDVTVTADGNLIKSINPEAFNTLMTTNEFTYDDATNRYARHNDSNV